MNVPEQYACILLYGFEMYGKPIDVYIWLELEMRVKIRLFSLEILILDMYYK